MVQNGAIIHLQEHGDVGGQGDRYPLDNETMILLPWLLQSHPQTGAASGVVLDQDPGGKPGTAGVEE